MEITYLGHSSFKIKQNQQQLSQIPMILHMVGLKFPKISGDIVTVSHNHADHNIVDLVKDVK